jgi:molecular chaperone GrpE
MAQTEEEEKLELYLPDNLQDCQAALAETRQAVDELKDKYLRAAAQVENVRKWTERDTLARAKEAQRNLLRQLLEVMDDLDRALSQPAEPDVLYEGVRLTRMQLEKVLARAGVQRIQVKPGQPFDPTYHEAVEVRHGNVNEPTVAAVIQPGYLHENELLRPAGVVVVQE